MGSASSKFRKHIQHGDEYAAMQVYHNSPELRKSLDPNLSYGEHHQHNTAMHYASKHGMKHLLRIFLTDLHGNPNKRNARNETALHLVCKLSLNAPPSAQDRRLACAHLILQWKGGFSAVSGNIEQADLKAQDMHGNTVLHLSAGSGLDRVVELLVSHGAPLFLENSERLTPCDVAMRANFHDIALFLESRMVFADAPIEMGTDLRVESSYARGTPSVIVGASHSTIDTDEVYTGLRAQDLQEAKDQLVVETADMLHIPLFTAEALLRDNEWSRELLLEKWMIDPVLCCESMGLQTPLSALRFRNSLPCEAVNILEASLEYLEAPPTSPCRSRISDQIEDFRDECCDICLEVIEQGSSRVYISCDHSFCRRCWSSYLTLKIIEGDANHVTCPALGCSMLVPVELIESLVSKETAKKYLHFDLNSFVATNPTIKWCPGTGCGFAVRLPESEQGQPNVMNIFSPKAPPRTSHAVDCGNGHFFCWECLSEAHAPSGCEQWVQWLQKVAEVRPEELKSTCTESEDAANCYWLVTNCKACPSCKSPIQKNEGCNHMKCSKCKFDFCWVCLDSWKKHSSATGGYFRCNRYEAMHKADEKQGSMISEAGQRNKQLQELNRFIHYYTRFKNHENSRLLEEPLLTSARRKMELLAASLPAARSPVLGHSDSKDVTAHRSSTSSVPACTRFIEEGIRELLKARRILCGSYVYGYYLEDNGYNKTIFEFMQNELESFTEKLSEMVARPYLRTPRSTIVDMTLKVRRKRHEFIRAVSKGLIPPETPPALRRVRRRRFPGLMGMDPIEDDQITEAIAISLRQLDPNNPWVKDSQGRHTNLSAIYDWPDANSDEEDSDVNQALTVSLLGVCDREGCGRPRARNPRNGKIHPFCSLRCSRSESLDQPSVAPTDFAMDLVIALEMSRLQLIEDEVRKQNHDQTATSNTEFQSPSVDGYSEDAQLRLAIFLSLEESGRLATESGVAAASQTAESSVDNFLKNLAQKQELPLKNYRLNQLDPNSRDSKTLKSLFTPTEKHGESEGRFEISELHQNAGFFSSSLGEDQQLDTVSDGAVSSLPFPKRSHSACDIRTGVHIRCPSLELESHDCIHELVEGISQGPPTRTLLRLQSLGTDYGSDEFGTCTSSEENGQAKEEEIQIPIRKLSKPKLVRQANVSGKAELSCCSHSAHPPFKHLPLVESESFNSENTLPTPADEDQSYDQGIPRSPTLYCTTTYISGVAISRTPEPGAQSNESFDGLVKSGRGNRSSSLTTAALRGILQIHPLGRGLSKSAGRLNINNYVVKDGNSRKKKRKHIRRLTMPAMLCSDNCEGSLSPFPSPSPRIISRSACEPQRDKEVFYFPKSPTESQLSTVLLVRDFNKRDAFHEALFLPREQKRKRSKKILATSTATSVPTELSKHDTSCEVNSDRREEKQSGSQESSVL
ncbi:ankyrin repeat and IBR domain-containing protein 1-like isoform X2 [Daphnia pulex]|uniref:ankyrin repeat and IBR domain-containing protein 1-like isoform X2 n=1 Tax=Daphnia pulex TaxID=6669 RepID=UPI001EDED36E|nr:ankyrin repeat and IBR domain-containing protein 1-like isoform X2 [Daphnia pulex]